MDDLVGAQCGTVVGLYPRDEEWLSGKRMTGVWYGTPEDAAAHQDAMDLLPYAGLEALSSNGLRYPIPRYGINNDVRAGMGVSYSG